MNSVITAAPTDLFQNVPPSFFKDVKLTLQQVNGVRCLLLFSMQEKIRGN